MSDNEQYAAGFAAGFAAGREAAEDFNALRNYVEQISERLADLDARLNDVSLRLRQIERPKMTTEEALDTFDVLKRHDASLTLPSFAAQYGLSYEALRKARVRRRRKE